MGRPARAARVILVGAGPGDPELITVRGLRALWRADVVVYDRLVAPQLVAEAPQKARRYAVGKAPGHQPWPQPRINALLVAEARRGRKVVRLKGGDPFVFGRGGEECEALVGAGIDFEVVPGVSSAIAAAAFAGIPLTHREHASAFAVVTGRTAAEGPDDAIGAGDGRDWDALARIPTLVVMMGLGRLSAIAEELISRGRSPQTPLAVIHQASSEAQTVVRGTLGQMVRRKPTGVTPATIVIGDVVALAASLEWFVPLDSPQVACL